MLSSIFVTLVGRTIFLKHLPFHTDNYGLVQLLIRDGYNHQIRNLSSVVGAWGEYSPKRKESYFGFFNATSIIVSSNSSYMALIILDQWWFYGLHFLRSSSDEDHITSQFYFFLFNEISITGWSASSAQ